MLENSIYRIFFTKHENKIFLWDLSIRKLVKRSFNELFLENSNRTQNKNPLNFILLIKSVKIYLLNKLFLNLVGSY